MNFPTFGWEWITAIFSADSAKEEKLRASKGSSTQNHLSFVAYECLMTLAIEVAPQLHVFSAIHRMSNLKLLSQSCDSHLARCPDQRQRPTVLLSPQIAKLPNYSDGTLPSLPPTDTPSQPISYPIQHHDLRGNRIEPGVNHAGPSEDSTSHVWYAVLRCESFSWCITIVFLHDVKEHPAGMQDIGVCFRDIASFKDEHRVVFR
ncbi:hypothetical protein TIFTF001_037816 [Ficus carica]|uniref:Uncharacterized protein n=1 Tax=Ficus carica TaxID=3494 RepID=A0AA88E6X2_FICCA|nr:hypothetical protein TIFTF001_037816 [Ficus carica]